MLNNDFLCLFALAGMTSVAASPLSESTYSAKGRTPGLGATIGDAITKAFSVVTSGLYPAIVGDDDSATNFYDQISEGAVSSSDGNGPVVVLPSTYIKPKGILKGTVKSLDESKCRGVFVVGDKQHNFTVIYGSRSIPEGWNTHVDAAYFNYFDESQFADGTTWSIDTSKLARIGAKDIFLPLVGNNCGNCDGCRHKCPVLTGSLQRAISQGYPMDGKGSWRTV